MNLELIIGIRRCNDQPYVDLIGKIGFITKPAPMNGSTFCFLDLLPGFIPIVIDVISSWRIKTKKPAMGRA
jgi:hypothetical protein